MNTPRIVLGIDPGSQVTGFGVLRVQGASIQHISHGLISLPGHLSFHERVGALSQEIEALIERIQPSVTVVERIFLGKNVDSAFKLGHARGVAVAAAIRAGSDVVEYAARAVKKGVTGNGASSKDQVQMILFATLGIKTQVRADASDALALAFYHARQLEIEKRLENEL